MSASARIRGVLSGVLARLAAQDLILLGYLTVMWTLVAMSGSTSDASVARWRIEACAAVLVGGCLVGHSRRFRPRVRTAIYRIALATTVAASYLMLRDLLPLLRPGSYDALLDRLDRCLFGVAPTLWLEGRMTPFVVEYFAFFYLSYFALVVGFALLAMGPWATEESAAELSVGTSVVYGLGQLGYVLVPGFGPVHQLATAYRGPLVGGPIWDTVLAVVATGGAMKDAFPSVHVADHGNVPNLGIDHLLDRAHQ